MTRGVQERARDDFDEGAMLLEMSIGACLRPSTSCASALKAAGSWQR